MFFLSFSQFLVWKKQTSCMTPSISRSIGLQLKTKLTPERVEELREDVEEAFVGIDVRSTRRASSSILKRCNTCITLYISSFAGVGSIRKVIKM